MLNKIKNTVDLLIYVNNNLSKKVPEKYFKPQEENLNKFIHDMGNIKQILEELSDKELPKDKDVILIKLKDLKEAYIQINNYYKIMYELIEKVYLNYPLRPYHKKN